MINELKIGPQLTQDGTQTTARGGKSGETITGAVHAPYYEATYRGNIYSVANQAGITTQAGLSLTTPALTLYNPTGSGVNAIIIYAGCVATVAFAAASVIWLGVNTNLTAAQVTGTLTTTHRNGLLGSANSPKIQPLLAATLPAAPVAIATLGVGLTGAITTVPASGTLGRFFDGSLILYPGSAISFQTSTASGASGFFGEFLWEEFPI